MKDFSGLGGDFLYTALFGWQCGISRVHLIVHNMVLHMVNWGYYCCSVWIWIHRRQLASEPTELDIVIWSSVTHYCKLKLYYAVVNMISDGAFTKSYNTSVKFKSTLDQCGLLSVKSVDMTGSYMFYSTYKVNSLKFKMNIYKPL